MKLQGVLTPLRIGAYFVAVVVIFVIFTLLWQQGFQPLATTNVPANSMTANQINQLGNGFFENTMPEGLVVFYFILVAAMFISAIALGAEPYTLPIGLAIGVVAIIVSMPISDAAHSILYNAQLLPASQYYSGAIYILNYLPYETGLEIMIYLFFATMVAERVRGAIGMGGLSTPQSQYRG